MVRLAAVASVVAAAIVSLPLPALAAICSLTPGSSTFESDFDGDGQEDLVVGAPGEDVGVVVDAGIIQVLYWGRGRGSDWDDVFSQNTPGVPDDSEPLDRWGQSRAWGDFDGDGYCDLAVGGAEEDEARGQVTVLFGSSRGLTAQGAQSFTQDTPGVLGTSEPGDRFGAALIAGHFGRGPEADLAIGVPGEDIGTIVDAGQVNVLFGGSEGLRTPGDEVIHQDSPGIKGAAEAFDRFGSVLSAGDMGKTRSFELIIGVPEEDIGAVEDAGAVQVVFGSTSGLTETDMFWSQGTEGIKGEPETDGFFGQAVVAGDFGKTTARELAIGAPGATVDAIDDAGQVHVLYGSADGPTLHDQLFLGRGSDDFYGYRLAAGQWGRTQRSDLAVARPGAGENQQGSVSMFYGNTDGFGSSPNTGMKKNYYPDGGWPVDNDYWTSGGLAFLDVHGDGYADLALGSILDEESNTPDHGTVMLYSGGIYDGDGNDEDAGVLHQDFTGSSQGYAALSGTAETGDEWAFLGSNSVTIPLGP